MAYCPDFKAGDIEVHTISFIVYRTDGLHICNSYLLGPARLIEISVNRSIYNRKTIINMKIQKSVTFNGCSIHLFN